jgi:peroxiredoxin
VAPSAAAAGNDSRSLGVGCYTDHHADFAMLDSTWRLAYGFRRRSEVSPAPSGGIIRRFRIAPACAFLVLAAVLMSGAAVTATAQIQDRLNGLWDAVLIFSGVEIPFRYEIVVQGTQAHGFFFDGDQRIGSSSGSYAGGDLRIEYEHLGSVLDAHIEGAELVGTYRSDLLSARPIPVRAKRFAPVQADADAPEVAGDWIMSRLEAERTAPRDTRTWTLFLRQSGAEVTGSILRVDGDTGTLSGHFTAGKLVLSHFAGERLTRVEATLNADGTLAITLGGNAHYIAARSSEAHAKGIADPPDPSRYTSVKDPTEPFHFTGLAMDGKTVSDTDPRFKGKVVILTIGGSWCPNCHDEAPFLTELYNKFHEQGLEIVGLSFESDADPAVAQPRMQSFISRYDIQYPMLLMGDVSQVKTKLPQIVNFGAFPTSIYLGRDGRVRSMHAGFASPATGEEHVRLKNEITELVERLLAEDPSAH